MEYFAHLLVFMSIYAIAAMGLNFIVGYSGLLSLAHAAHFAIGAYAFALMTVVAHWGAAPALAVAAVTGFALGAASSLTAWRLRGDFFVLATLAIQMLIFSVVQNWSRPGLPLGSFENLTNGSLGIAGIPRPSIGSWQITSTDMFAVFAVAIALVAGVIAYRLGDSPWAKLLQATRDNELAAASLGKDTRLAKTEAMAIGGAFAAIGGALYATYVGYLDPSSASLDMSILLLTMIIIGGSGNLIGPIVGAAVVVMLPEVLRSLDVPDATAGNVRQLIYGLLIVAIIHFRPSGISGDHRVG